MATPSYKACGVEVIKLKGIKTCGMVFQEKVPTQQWGEDLFGTRTDVYNLLWQISAPLTGYGMSTLVNSNSLFLLPRVSNFI